MPRAKREITDQFEDLRDRLAEWRKSQPPSARLPEEVWKAAVELARRHGVYRTARALPIDYGGLRKRLNQAPSRESPAAQPRFLEVLLPPSAQSDNCVELMRVRFSGGALEWDQLLRAWRGQ